MDVASAWLDPLFSSLDYFVTALIDYLPTVFSALGVLFLGLVIGWLFKYLVLRVSVAAGNLVRRITGNSTQTSLRLPWPLSVVTANVIFWLTVLFFLTLSLQTLGLPGIAGLIAEIARILPRIIVAAAIILGGYVFASIVRDALRKLGSGDDNQSELPARVAFLAINIIASLVGLDQLGIDLFLIESALLVAIAAVCGGLAFAFGQGASHSLDNIIASYYVRKVYRRGQRIRLGSVEGTILDLTPTAVVVDTVAGRALIPARKFNDEVSLLLGHEDFRRD